MPPDSPFYNSHLSESEPLHLVVIYVHACLGVSVIKFWVEPCNLMVEAVTAVKLWADFWA